MGAIVTVGQLIAKLQGLHTDTRVVVASDAEGNSFEECSDVSVDTFDRDMEHDEDGDECVVIWP